MSKDLVQLIDDYVTHRACLCDLLSRARAKGDSGHAADIAYTIAELDGFMSMLMQTGSASPAPGRSSSTASPLRRSK